MQTDEAMTKILATPLYMCVDAAVALALWARRAHWCLVSTQRQTLTIAYYAFVRANGLFLLCSYDF